MDKHRIPGVSIVIINNAKVVWHQSLGYKNIHTLEPVSDNTIFEGASFSKPLFAYAVLQLAERGVIGLDVPLANYYEWSDLKECPYAKLITARMVLSHSTGLPNWRPDGEDLQIYFRPGEKFSYSGEGFVYLQKVVEHLTKTPLDVYMKNILNSLGMIHSSYVWQDEYKNLKASPHGEDGIARENTPRLVPNAAASLHTTALEYAKFIIAIMQGTGLRPSTIQEMLKPQIKINLDCVDCTKEKSSTISTHMQWGLGWGLLSLENGSYFWHWGNNPGFRNYVFSSLNGNHSVIIMTNSSNGLKFIPEALKKMTSIDQPTFKWLEAPY